MFKQVDGLVWVGVGALGHKKNMYIPLKIKEPLFSGNVSRFVCNK